MARRNTNTNGNVNGGLSRLGKQDFAEALRSIHKFDWDRTGAARFDNPTRSQLSALRHLAAKPDLKIKADTGEETPVWELIIHSDHVDIIHLRYRSKWQLIEDSKARIASIGRIEFTNNVAHVMPTTDEQEQGLLELIQEQNRLAAKYGRKVWEYTVHNGVYHIAKMTQVAF